MLSIQITGIAETVKVLNSIDKEIVKTARKDLKTAAEPVVLSIKSSIPTDAPLRGMMHNGRTGWNKSGVRVRLKTNFSKKAERRGSQLVSIVVGGTGQGAAAFQIADISGRKSRGSTASGRAMIRKLNTIHGASRYVYPAAEREIPLVRDQMIGTIKKLTKRYNDELRKGK